ncbi:MAG TPA: SIS domain-containing protein [Bacteroidales bacterium]|jgi:D-sedoheptulose 7-phosphate isomerase|nr:SIS domain-containing protein [Bacteroidales bacterium]HPB25643.1 SIS domain-containing protein [Bacteroidales bacterium]HPI29633.1 SIS domain-containing protein [Bacteroidales bacterium]HQN16008.1 SIS domain-containing protein [Bacteroidales bacterium]HQP15314.1 SIS domain-containing protein [Bacteroidales bacterium]
MDIEQCIKESIEVKKRLLANPDLLLGITNLSIKAAEVLKNKGRILLCGNGGSAADAQHIAAELSGRFMLDRDPLDAEALHVNTSYLTSVANDYSFGEVYARLLRAKGRPGDMLIAISTSGNSTNIIRAVEAAKEAGLITAGLTGASGGQMKNLVDFLINVPSDETPRIQEAHILIGHIFCQQVEEEMFGKDRK